MFQFNPILNNILYKNVHLMKFTHLIQQLTIQFNKCV